MRVPWSAPGHRPAPALGFHRTPLNRPSVLGLSPSLVVPLLALTTANLGPATASPWAASRGQETPALATPLQLPSQPDPAVLASAEATKTGTSSPCQAAIASHPLGPQAAPPSARPPMTAAPSNGADGDPLSSGLSPAPALPGYASSLRSTAFGWPRLAQWCVWIEPPTDPEDPWQRRWLGAVEGALDAWAELLPVRRVRDQAAAQLRVWRRRPPLAIDQAGRTRASHGRALLEVVAAQRQQGQWRLEPSVDVLLSPGQRAEALQATAVHELGHGFGLWGHSPNASDALAASPGPVPVQRPSAGDRATMQWLQRQPTRFGQPLTQPSPPRSRYGLEKVDVGRAQRPGDAPENKP